MTLATAMYWTQLNPMNMKPLFVAKDWKDRKLQQALLQRHKPEHREIIREYEREKRISAKRAEEIGGQKTDYGTGDARTPKALRPTQPQRKKRSVVDVPKNKLGPKLFLDSR